MGWSDESASGRARNHRRGRVTLDARGVGALRGRRRTGYASALMFVIHRSRTLISMSELRAGIPLADWSDVAVSELPTGTVTLLLADVEVWHARLPTPKR